MLAPSGVLAEDPLHRVRHGAGCDGQSTRAGDDREVLVGKAPGQAQAAREGHLREQVCGGHDEVGGL